MTSSPVYPIPFTSGVMNGERPRHIAGAVAERLRSPQADCAGQRQARQPRTSPGQALPQSVPGYPTTQ